MTLVIDRAEIERQQRERLGPLLAEVVTNCPFYKSKFAGCDTKAFSQLPFTTKAELVADQQRYPPYGSVLTHPRGRYTRLHHTSGTSSGRTLFWHDTPESWAAILECWKTNFDIAQVRPDDRFYFAFSFGPFLGFWSAFEAAQAQGHFVLAGGGMSSGARLRAIFENDIKVVCCTPTYALHLAETARRDGINLAGSPVRMLIVAGEPGGSIPSVRTAIESVWGARVIDHCGMTETGPLGMECAENPAGMHVIETQYNVEVIDPESALPCPPGVDGELVVTTLRRSGSPLIRYRTGDIVRVDPVACPCGQAFVRLQGGILGRTDDMIHLRGNNVYPAAIEGVLRSIAEIAEFRLNVDRSAPLHELQIEIEPAAGAARMGLAERTAQAIRDRLHFRAEVSTVEPGALPRFEMKARRISHK